MYKIKSIPQDFIVTEKIDLALDPKGKYTFYRLTKTDRGLFAIIPQITQALHTTNKYFNYCGIKDKKAITTQYFSIYQGPKKNITGNGFEITHVGEGSERLNIGALRGNDFEITVRDIRITPKGVRDIPNYYDSQRFGANGDNQVIGKLLLQAKFSEATKAIEEDQNHILKGTSDIEKLRSMQKKHLQLYVHAYQSLLWNKVVALYLQERCAQGDQSEDFFFPHKTPGQEEIPIIGFMTRCKNKRIEELYNKMLLEDGLTERNFLLRPLNGLCFEGGDRPLLAPVEDLQISELSDDELYKGASKCTLKFFLQKGSYATIAIRAMCLGNE